MDIDLSSEIFHCGIKRSIHAFSKLSHIHEVLLYLNCSEMTHKKEVLEQPINVMSVTIVVTESTVYAFEYFALKSCLISSKRRFWTSKCTYIDNLNDKRQKTCPLLIDEVYVMAILQFHGETVLGKSVNTNSNKYKLWHRCFPVNFVKFLRTPFLIEQLWWLLL